MPLGLGIGIHKIAGSFIQRIINAFKDRILRDGGTFEGESYLKSYINNLIKNGLYTNAVFILYPCAYKVSKLYALITTSGSMDFTVTRAGGGIRLNSQSVFEVVASNIPRIDYTYTDPSAIIDPSRTNLTIQSALQSGWSANVPGDYTVTSDTIFGLACKKLVNINADAGVRSGRGIRHTGQSIATVSGTTYAISFYVKVTGANTNFSYYILNSSQISATFDVVAGTRTVGDRDSCTSVSFKIESLGNNIYRCTDVITATASITYTQITLGFGLNSTTSGMEGSIGLLQIEAGVMSTGYIDTTTASVTRVFETLVSATGFNCSGDFTFMFEAKMYNSGANERLYLYNTSAETTAAFQFLTTTVRWADSKNSFNAIGASNANQTTRNKYIIRRVGSVVSIFMNGAQQGSNYTIPSNNWGTIDNLYMPTAFGGNLFQARMYNFGLTDAQCIAETT